MTGPQQSGGETEGRFARPGGHFIAYRTRPGKPELPMLVWMGGYRSDMRGTKVEALASFCAARGQPFLAYDHFAHGASSGAIEDGTIGRFRDDALAVLDTLTAGPLLLVGSSMGGWVALLAALARPERVGGLLLIAPAPDFVDELMFAGLPREQQRLLLDEGQVSIPSAYGPEPYVFTHAMLEDGRRHALLGGPIAYPGPVRILQGQRDPDVPWRRALTLAERLESDDVRVTLVKDGDHRLSRPRDLALLTEAAAALSSPR